MCLSIVNFIAYHLNLEFKGGTRGVPCTMFCSMFLPVLLICSSAVCTPHFLLAFFVIMALLGAPGASQIIFAEFSDVSKLVTFIAPRFPYVLFRI